MHSCSKKIKVLFIISLLQRMGGAEKNLFDIVDNLDKDHFQSIVIAFKGGEVLDRLKNKGFEVYENGVTKLASKEAVRKAFELKRFVKNHHVDIIVSYHHDADIWGYLVSLMSGGVPIISSRRDMGYQLSAIHIWFYRLFGRRFAKMITVSEAVKREVSKREWIDPDKIVTIHNGLDPNIYRGGERTLQIRTELGLTKEHIVLGTVASFRPIKGQLYLVEAIKNIAGKYPNIRVVFVGYNDTEYFHAVLRRVGELGLGEHFIFTGARSDIPDLLSIFDIFVISSVNEGFSNAIIEAMAACKPIVAPDSGGNPESVQDNFNGLLFRACDSLSLSEKLGLLISDPEKRRVMGCRGSDTVEKNFHYRKMIKKFGNLLKEVVRCEKKN